MPPTTAGTATAARRATTPPACTGRRLTTSPITGARGAAAQRCTVRDDGEGDGDATATGVVAGRRRAARVWSAQPRCRARARAATNAGTSARPPPRPKRHHPRRGRGHPRGAPGRVARALSRRRLPSVDLCAHLAQPERGGGIPYRLQRGYPSDTNQRPFEFFPNILRPILGVKLPMPWGRYWLE